MVSEAFSNLIDSVITELVTVLWKRFMGIAPWRFIGIAPGRFMGIAPGGSMSLLPCPQANSPSAAGKLTACLAAARKN